MTIAARRGVGETVEQRPPIDLAKTPEFTLGGLVARPTLREVSAPDGRKELLEPRVMQVLVALAQAGGEVVTREDLTASCWEGRIVGEDAINRVISRLRRLAEGIGEGHFRIETVTKVGYRLIAAAEPPPAPPPTARAEVRAKAEARRALDRRGALVGGVLALAGVAGGGYVAWRWFKAQPPSAIAPLLYQASVAMQQGTAEGADQAIGLLRSAIQIRPGYADAWGMLALCYAISARGRAPQLQAELTVRAEEAARRAETLKPGEPNARVAKALLIPQMGRWAEIERVLRDVLADHPGNQPLLLSLAELMGSVGRWKDAAGFLDEAAAESTSTPTPALAQQHTLALWAAGRREEADRSMAQAFALYPSQFAVWFARFHLMLYSGRPQEALAQNANLEGRPAGIPETSFLLNEAVARAMLTKSKTDVEVAVGQAALAAREGAGYAENAIQYASALGRLDAAFEVAEAYYFGAGFSVADLRFSQEQRTYTRSEDRRTQFLFYPSTTALRADPRFDALVRRLALDRYWREMSVEPDYRRK